MREKKFMPLRCCKISSHLADSAFSVHYCRLLVIFAKRLDPDQARQIVGADLDLNCLMVFLKYFFEKADFERSKEEGKYQESIQSSITHNSRQHMEK